MRRALVVLGLVGLLAHVASAQGRAAFAEIEVQGPCELVVIDAGPPGTARIEGRLALGETQRVVVPVPVEAGAEPRAPRLDAGAGAARFLGWRPRAERLAQIPAALRARPVPLAVAPRVRAGPALLLVLAATFALGAWARRSAVAVALLGLAGAAAAFGLARGALERDEAPVEVLDGVSGSTSWQRQRAARDDLELPSRGATFDLTTDPARARLEIVVPLDPARPARARARGAGLVAVWAEPWPAAALERAANELVPLSAAWLREDGDWTRRGRWELGAPLGPPVPGGAPPGWIASGLPQGVTIVVGEVEGAPGSWVRCTWP